MEVFEKDDEQQKCNLLEAFYKLTYNKNMSVMDNIAEIQALVHKLQALKQTMDEDMVMVKILSILPSTYDVFTTAWDSTPKEEKSMKNLVRRLVEVEKKF